MLAIPFAELGVDAAAGETFAFNFLRISGANGGGYAGWLACGPFFSVGHDYNPGLTEDNKLVLVNEYVEPEVPEIVIPEGAVQGTASAAPDFNAAITEDAWGKPVMSVADGKGNAVVYSYEGTPDADLAADMYFRWDATNLYVGMVTADADIKGDDATYKGDGIQFRINAGEAMGDFIDVYVTLAGDNSTVQWGSNKLTALNCNIVIADGKLNVMFAIPFADLGV
jgi:hypothetical protein